MTVSQGLDPASPRRLFGAELRRLRREQGKLLSDVAKHVMFSPSKLSRLEKGQSVPQERDVRDLLDYYGQSGTELGDRMHRWALEGREALQAWREATDTVPSTIEQYMQYETAASLIYGYVSHFVPSLLQTASYARALISALNSTDPDEIAALVDLRLRRQEVISRDEFPVSLDIIIDESVFHRVVGTPTIMREQIARLADASELPNVTLRVHPFSAGPHAALSEGTFTIFQFRQPIDQEVVNIESMITEVYIDQPERVARYRESLDGLKAIALSPAESTQFIRRMSHSLSVSQ
ncbi:MAG: helix-turn-helix domain-containing protein [Pseudonocardia sp.]|nr:helix-turn-helix domain-containing protein [Pseudonocardia sp.]